MDDCSNISRLVGELEGTDKYTRELRARGLGYVRGLIRPEPAFQYCGGPISVAAINEARVAYVHGLYLSTILLAVAFVEHEITARLVMAGGVDLGGRPDLHKILCTARGRGVLTPEEFSALDDLRQNRNPYTHYRSFEERNSYRKTDEPGEHNEFKSPSHVTDRMEPDARKALETVESLLGRDWFDELRWNEI